jgi:MoxR-like ATPase
MKKLRDYQKDFIVAAAAKFGPVLSKKDAVALAKELGMGKPTWFYKNLENRVSHGKYRLPSIDGATPAPAVLTVPVATAPMGNTDMNMAANVVNITDKPAAAVVSESLVPTKDPTYTPFGFSKDLKTILASRIFYPVYITGLSGNGKSFMVDQLCAQLGLNLIRINITAETDDDDLFGGFRLVDGQTLFFKGPVIRAMELGCPILIDEVDAGNPNKLLGLQAVLEGKPYYIKKTGELITPKDGFTIIATANTKGKGSEDGRFVGTSVMNEAFLDRFVITVEQEYPAPSIEKKILKKNFQSLGLDETDTFIDRLVEWADIIRKTFMEDGCDELIATRRLVHISKTYKIFGDRMKAVTLGIARFDDETKETFADLYTKIDGELDAIEAAKLAAENGETEVEDAPATDAETDTSTNGRYTPF